MKMDSDPCVSLIITAFNDGRFISDAISSVLAQTRQPCEIIVIDDGSTDGTEQVVRRFPEVKYRWQENAGVSAARNAGLALATGTHVLFLDADDVLFPETLERGLEVLINSPELGFVYGGYDEISPAGVRKEVPVREFPDPYLELLGWDFVPHFSAIYNAQALRDIGGFSTELMMCEDWDVVLTLSRKHPIKPYFYTAGEYRRRHGSLSKRDPLMMMDQGHDVLRRQQDLNAEQQVAKDAGWAAVTRVYSLMAAWTFVALLRKGKFGEARSLATGATKRSPLFWRQVVWVTYEVARRVVSPQRRAA